MCMLCLFYVLCYFLDEKCSMLDATCILFVDIYILLMLFEDTFCILSVNNYMLGAKFIFVVDFCFVLIYV